MCHVSNETVPGRQISKEAENRNKPQIHLGTERRAKGYEFRCLLGHLQTTGSPSHSVSDTRDPLRGSRWNMQAAPLAAADAL